MKIWYRVCYTAVTGMLTLDSRNNKFEGVFSPLVNTYLDEADHVNYSFVAEKSFGTVIDHENMIFDGCIGSMQRNESDLAFLSIASPIIGPNITQGTTTGFEQISILSAYNPETEQVDADIVTFFSVFDRSLIMLLLLTMSGFTIMLACVLRFFTREARIIKSYKARNFSKHRHTKPSYRSGWQKAALFVLTRWLKQFSAYNITRRVSTIRVLMLLITIFCFVIQCYIFSLVKTDLAVVKPPVTVEDYNDILNRETLLPMWIVNLGDYGLFKYAEPGTKERQVWDKAVSMNDALMSSSMFSFERMLSGDISSITKTLKQESVLLLGRTSIYINRRNICSYASNLPPEQRSLSRVTVDPHSKEKVFAFAFNANVNPCTKLAVNHRSQAIFEAGIREMNQKQTGVMMPCSDANQMRACMSDQVVMRPAVVHPPGNWFYRRMWYLCGALFCLSCIILLVESRKRRGRVGMD